MKSSTTAKFNKIILLALLAAMLGIFLPSAGTAVAQNVKNSEVVKTDPDSAISDSNARYESQHDEVKVMYLRINTGSGKRNHTWNEVNAHDLSWYKDQRIEPYECEALMQMGDSEGPLAGQFGFNETASNVKVRLRGENASARAQKSYKITLLSGKGKYNGMKEFQLNKYSKDPVRFTTALAYSLMAEIEDMFSARTEFVQLYVRDSSGEEDDGCYHDYGLFTLVEPVDESYMKNRGLDEKGPLYYANDFDWQRHADVIKPGTDAAFRKEAMDQILETEIKSDNTDLIRMLEAVNDESIPVSDLLDRYFNKANLYSYMAFHMLCGDQNAGSSGFYLYKPRMLDQWWLISGDSHHAFRSVWKKMQDPLYTDSWKTGIYSFADNVLFDRILKDETCRKELDETAEKMIQEHLNKEVLSEKVEMLKTLTAEKLYSLPDMLNMRFFREDYESYTDLIPSSINSYKTSYSSSLSKPWPFSLKTITAEKDKLKISWDESWLPQSEVTYSVVIADEWTFENPVYSADALNETSVEPMLMKPGQYFIRLSATSKNGAKQPAREVYFSEDGYPQYGVICFYIRKGGTVDVSYFDDAEAE